jgi:hypothetical protein
MLCLQEVQISFSRIIYRFCWWWGEGAGGLKSAVLGCRVAYFTDPPSGSNSSEGCMHGGVLPHFGHNLIQPRERGVRGRVVT